MFLAKMILHNMNVRISLLIIYINSSSTNW